MISDSGVQEINIKTEIKEIKDQIALISEKLDLILKERDTMALMALSEGSLKEFLENEPDLYSVSDLRAVYR